MTECREARHPGIVRDLLLRGANNPQGAKLSVYQAHYLPHPATHSRVTQGGESPRLSLARRPRPSV